MKQILAQHVKKNLVQNEVPISGGQKWEQIIIEPIDIKKGFVQSDTYSPVGFCCTEIPVMMLLEESDGYNMGPPSTHTVYF